MISLILPGDPLFNETLMNPPPNWGEVADRDGDCVSFVADPVTGLFRAVTQAELEEYLEGGEYEERLIEIGEYDDLE
jgi:hypothetical protein